MWENGAFTINGIKYEFYAKVYDEGNRFGINGGRISKLSIYEWEPEGRREILSYDRGWDTKPKTNADKSALTYVLDKYA